MTKEFNTTVELVMGKNEAGREIIVNVLVGGKPVKKSYMNALTKAQKTSWWKLFSGEGTMTAQNPFSGEEVDVTPFEYSIVRWSYEWQRRYSNGDEYDTVQMSDNMRYLFLHLNSTAYLKLLD